MLQYACIVGNCVIRQNNGKQEGIGGEIVRDIINTFRKEMDKVSFKYNHGCYTVTCATLLIDCILLSPVVKETKGSGEGLQHVADTL